MAIIFAPPHFASKVSYSASPQTFTAFAVHTIVALLRLVLIAPSALALEIHFQRFQQRAVFRFEFGK